MRRMARTAHRYRNKRVMNCGPLYVNIDSGMPYGKTQLLRKHPATRSAVVSLIRMTRVNFEYKYMMSMIMRFTKMVFGSEPKMDRATNSNGTLDGKSLSFFCAFVNVPLAVTHG